MAIKADLVAAVKDKDLAKLKSSTEKAAEKNMTGTQEYSTAVKLKEVIEEEEGIISELQKAVDSKNLDSINESIGKAQNHTTASKRPELVATLPRETRSWKLRVPRRERGKKHWRRRLQPTWPPRMKRLVASYAKP